LRNPKKLQLDEIWQNLLRKGVAHKGLLAAAAADDDDECVLWLYSARPARLLVTAVSFRVLCGASLTNLLTFDDAV
jgi:hypothetical protein